MKNTYLLSLCFFVFIWVSCGEDVEENLKIDGQWSLESVLGGIQGGGLPVDGEVSMVVSECDLDLFKDAELIMESDISYSVGAFGQVILKLDPSYIDEQPEFLLGGGGDLIVRKSEDGNMLSLSELVNDGYSYAFRK